MEGTQHLQRNNRITVATIHTLKKISKDHTFHHASSAAQFLGTASINRRACVGSSHSPKPKPIQLRVVPQQYHIENTFLPNHSSTSHLPPLTSDPSHLSPLDPMPLHSHLSHLTLTSHPPTLASHSHLQPSHIIDSLKPDRTLALTHSLTSRPPPHDSEPSPLTSQTNLSPPTLPSHSHLKPSPALRLCQTKSHSRSHSHSYIHKPTNTNYPSHSHSDTDNHIDPDLLTSHHNSLVNAQSAQDQTLKAKNISKPPRCFFR